MASQDNETDHRETLSEVRRGKVLGTEQACNGSRACTPACMLAGYLEANRRNSVELGIQE